jgi:hypothetical protein
VRALLLAALLVASFATVAKAGNDGSSVPIHPDSSLVTSPNQTPLPAPEPVAAQPAPAPAPVVVATPWPENVPSLKPGSEKPAVATASSASQTSKAVASKTTTKSTTTGGTASTAPAASTASQTTASKTSATQNQVAALPPEPTNAASLTPVKVTLQAAIIMGAPPLREPLQWTVNKPGTNNKKIGLQVASMTGPRGEFSIPPGDYVVTIKQREAVVSQPLTVGTAGVTKTMVINTSIVAVRMILYTGGKIVTEPVHWEVFQTALGRPGPDSKVADAVAPEASFTLAAGYYVVRSHYHDASSDLAMLVEPAVSYHYTVDLYAATVVGRAVAASGASANDVKWQVVRSTAEPDGTHHVVATDSGPNPSFLVREGNYLVIATGADGSVGEAPLAVVAGRTHQVKVILKKGASATVKTSTAG